MGRFAFQVRTQFGGNIADVRFQIYIFFPFRQRCFEVLQVLSPYTSQILTIQHAAHLQSNRNYLAKNFALRENILSKSLPLEESAEFNSKVGHGLAVKYKCILLFYAIISDSLKVEPVFFRVRMWSESISILSFAFLMHKKNLFLHKFLPYAVIIRKFNMKAQ